MTSVWNGWLQQGKNKSKIFGNYMCFLLYRHTCCYIVHVGMYKPVKIYTSVTILSSYEESVLVINIDWDNKLYLQRQNLFLSISFINCFNSILDYLNARLLLIFFAKILFRLIGVNSFWEQTILHSKSMYCKSGYLCKWLSTHLQTTRGY